MTKIHIPQIHVHEQQRKELGDLAPLSQSMFTVGLLQPVVVRENGNGYILVAGARRLNAAIGLGWTEIDATIIETDDPGHALAQFHENAHRLSLTPVEEAEAIQQLLDAGFDVEAIGDRDAQRKARLNILPKEVLKQLSEGKLNLFEARLLGPTDRLVRVKSWWPYWDGNYLCWPVMVVDLNGYRRMTLSPCWDRARLLTIRGGKP